MVPLLCLAIAFLYRGTDVFGSLYSAILVYPMVCLASTIWSVNPYDTFKYSSLLLLYILAIASICQVLEIDVFCRIIVKVLVFLMLASVAMAVVFPRYGIHQLDDAAAGTHAGEWRGVFGHKNALGGAAAVSVFSFLFFGRFVGGSLGLRLMCIVAAITCLIFAHSAGSLVALCVVLVYYYLTRAVPVSGNILLLIVFGAAVSFIAFFPFIEDIAAVVGRDATLTGRTDIWPIVLDAIWQKPLLGFGYAAATMDFIQPLLVHEVGPDALTAHNGYLDVLLGTGAVGLAVLLFCISSVIRRGIDRVKMSSGPERDCFMLLVSFPIFSVFHSFVEVASMAGVEDVLGAFNFLSLTAIPLYLQRHPGNYRSVTSAANRGSAARFFTIGRRGAAG